MLAAIASCEDASEPREEPPIPLPPRDGATVDPDTPACDITDPNNCGRCGNVCPPGPRGAPACVNGRCALKCETGWGDCNASATDGCETPVSANVENCGACGRDCRSCGGASCKDGLCADTTLSTGPKDVNLLAIDATQVVYADGDGVAQVNKADAGVQSVYAVPNTPGLLVRDNVFFIYPGTEPNSGIYSTYVGFVGPLVASFGRGENVEAMALDDTGIYYSAEKGFGVSHLVRCKDCDVPTELSPSENAVHANAIALDATTVFFGAGDMIRRVEKTGADLKTLAVGQENPRSLGVDDTWVYWINKSPTVFDENAGAGPPSAEIVRTKKGGGTPEKLVTGLARPVFLTVTDTHLYVTDRGYGTGNGVLFRMSKDGKERVDLARNVTSLGGMAVDESCTYFGAGAQIRKTAR